MPETQGIMQLVCGHFPLITGGLMASSIRLGNELESVRTLTDGEVVYLVPYMQIKDTD